MTACSPPGPRALLKGKRLLEAGQTDEAVQELKSAVSLLPTNAAAWNYLGLAYHRAGQWTNAVEAYSRAIKLDRDLLEARFNLGCLWLDQDRLEPAKTEFTAYTLRRGNAVEGWLKLGMAQLRGREAVGAEKSFQEALRLDAKNLEALNGLGLAQLQRNHPREAAESFTDALKLQPDYRPALLNLATVSHQHLNNRTEALRRYREYLALQPRAADWETVNAIAQSLEQPVVSQSPPKTNVTVAAAPVTNQSKPPPVVATRPATNTKVESPVVVTKPAQPPAVVAKAPVTSPPPVEVVKLSPEPIIRSATEDSPTPVASAKLPALAAGSPPTNSTAPAPSSALPNPGNRRDAMQVLGQGQQAQRAGRLAEAIELFRRATQLDPSYFEAQYSLGLAAFNARSFRVALKAWEDALALRPDNVEARYNYALTLKAAKLPQDAANELEKLLALHPDEARGHLTLGNLYADQLRDIPRARQHYNKVLRLDPSNPQAPAIRYWLVANPG